MIGWGRPPSFFAEILANRKASGGDQHEAYLIPSSLWATQAVEHRVSVCSMKADKPKYLVPTLRSGSSQLLRLRRRGRGYRGVADGVTVDHQLDAAVALTAFGGVVRSDGLRFAEAAGGDGGNRDALLGEEIAHGIGAVGGELLIEFVAADAVRVALDLQREAGMREDDARNFG